MILNDFIVLNKHTHTRTRARTHVHTRSHKRCWTNLMPKTCCCWSLVGGKIFFKSIWIADAVMNIFWQWPKIWAQSVQKILFYWRFNIVNFALFRFRHGVWKNVIFMLRCIFAPTTGEVVHQIFRNFAGKYSWISVLLVHVVNVVHIDKLENHFRIWSKGRSSHFCIRLRNCWCCEKTVRWKCQTNHSILGRLWAFHQEQFQPFYMTVWGWSSVGAHWVPHSLTDDQKKDHVSWCQPMQQKFEEGQSNLVWEIATGDETLGV